MIVGVCHKSQLSYHTTKLSHQLFLYYNNMTDIPTITHHDGKPVPSVLSNVSALGPAPAVVFGAETNGTHILLFSSFFFP